MDRHTKEDEDKQQNADPKSGGWEPEHGQAGKDLPGVCAGKLVILVSGTDQHDRSQYEVFQLLAIGDEFLWQAKLFFAVKELLLDETGQPINKITQTAERANKPAKKASEQDRKAAQTKQRNGKAFKTERLSGADPQKDPPHTGKPGNECAGHRKKEEGLNGCPQDRPLPESALTALCRRERFLIRFHQDTAFPRASAAALIIPSAVRVAPETVSTSVDWTAMI